MNYTQKKELEKCSSTITDGILFYEPNRLTINGIIDFNTIKLEPLCEWKNSIYSEHNIFFCFNRNKLEMIDEEQNKSLNKDGSYKYWEKKWLGNFNRKLIKSKNKNFIENKVSSEFIKAHCVINSNENANKRFIGNGCELLDENTNINRTGKVFENICDYSSKKTSENILVLGGKSRPKRQSSIKAEEIFRKNIEDDKKYVLNEITNTRRNKSIIKNNYRSVNNITNVNDKDSMISFLNQKKENIEKLNFTNTINGFSNSEDLNCLFNKENNNISSIENINSINTIKNISSINTIKNISSIENLYSIENTNITENANSIKNINISNYSIENTNITENANSIKNINISNNTESLTSSQNNHDFNSEFCGIVFNRKKRNIFEELNNNNSNFENYMLYKEPSTVDRSKVLSEKTNLIDCRKNNDKIGETSKFFSTDLVFLKSKKNGKKRKYRKYIKQKTKNTLYNSKYQTIIVKKKSIISLFNCAKAVYKNIKKDKRVKFNFDAPSTDRHNNSTIIEPILLESPKYDGEFEWNGDKQVVEIIKRLEFGSDVSIDEFQFRRVNENFI